MKPTNHFSGFILYRRSRVSSVLCRRNNKGLLHLQTFRFTANIVLISFRKIPSLYTISFISENFLNSLNKSASRFFREYKIENNTFISRENNLFLINQWVKGTVVHRTCNSTNGGYVSSYYKRKI